MARTDEAGSSARSDTLTVVTVSVLALLAAAATAFCVIYAIWWLITFWAPV